MKLKCNTCSNPVTISGPVKIYSGEFCSAGYWDERGADNTNKRMAILSADPWKYCHHYNCITKNNKQLKMVACAIENSCLTIKQHKCNGANCCDYQSTT